MVKPLLFLLLILASLPSFAQRNINFNSYWIYTYKGQTKQVTLPRAWNEEEAFRVSAERLSTDTVRYKRTFIAPKSWKDKKVFVEFEGVRQSAEVWLNGIFVGRHENGAMAFGFDITPYVELNASNVIEVLTNNNWDYKERNISSADATLKEATPFQWNAKGFNTNYGGITKNVKLHVIDKLYQTLPLYSNLGTQGTYIYATNIDTRNHTAVINSESEVKNESSKDRTITYEMEVYDRDGKSLDKFTTEKITIEKGQTMILKSGGYFTNLHFWSWGYGYLYTVKTRILEGKKIVDEVSTLTGFRKTEFADGQFKLNDRTMMIHGYAQTTSNEWPGVGSSVPAWMSDYSNGLMVESGANLVRWMHVTPSKQDIESCDRVGLIQVMPAGDTENDVVGRQWEQRKELMRDAIIYNRNNPSVIFYECGNNEVSESHMLEMKKIRDQYDFYGGRAVGSREMLSKVSCAEYGGDILSVNKSANKPLWAMEYCNDELSSAIENDESRAVELVRRWYDFWRERPGTGKRVSGGAAKSIFSDTNINCNEATSYSNTGMVSPMRIEKDAFYTGQVMWNGWVTPDSSITHIIGHWNYPEGTIKTVYVVSDAPRVRLFLNNIEVGQERISHHFLHTFDNVLYQPGELLAVSYDEKGKELSYQRLHTAGAPIFMSMGVMISDKGMKADGADMAIIQIEVTDRENRRCPFADNIIHFDIEGPIEWVGNEMPVVGSRQAGYDVPLKNGVTRILVRSTGEEGKATVRATSKGVTGSSNHFSVKKRKETQLKGSLYQGETPSSPSYIDTRRTVVIRDIMAGCNNLDARKSIDDSEDTEWKNDGRASTAWITYNFERPSRIDEVVLKLAGWRDQHYPLEIYADDLLVWKGITDVSHGYVHLPLAPVDDISGRTICPACSKMTIRLKGASEETKHELRIIEADFLEVQ